MKRMEWQINCHGLSAGGKKHGPNSSFFVCLEGQVVVHTCSSHKLSRIHLRPEERLVATFSFS